MPIFDIISMRLRIIGLFKQRYLGSYELNLSNNLRKSIFVFIQDQWNLGKTISKLHSFRRSLLIIYIWISTVWWRLWYILIENFGWVGHSNPKLTKFHSIFFHYRWLNHKFGNYLMYCKDFYFLDLKYSENALSSHHGSYRIIWRRGDYADAKGAYKGYIQLIINYLII